MTKSFGPLMVLLAGVVSSEIAWGNCASIVDDLKAMQKAHKNISTSLISNHESFASILEEYSNTLKTSASLGHPVTKEAVVNMNESASAFRVRGQNAQKLNVKLNQASDEVIATAIACLKVRK